MTDKHFKRTNPRFEYIYNSIANQMRYPKTLKENKEIERQKRADAQEADAEQAIEIASSTESEPSENQVIDTTVPEGISKVSDDEPALVKPEPQPENDQSVQPQLESEVCSEIDDLHPFWKQLQSEECPLRQVRRKLKKARKNVESYERLYNKMMQRIISVGAPDTESHDESPAISNGAALMSRLN